MTLLSILGYVVFAQHTTKATATAIRSLSRRDMSLHYRARSCRVRVSTGMGVVVVPAFYWSSHTTMAVVCRVMKYADWSFLLRRLPCRLTLDEWELTSK